MKISLIIPAMNEEQNLPKLLEKINYENFTEVILVDGKSSDDTIKIAKKLIPSISILNQKSCGKGAAMKEGADYAKSDYLIFIDADGSMKPNETNVIISKLTSGYDFVKGTRNSLGGNSFDITLFRRIGNLVFTKLTNLLYHSDYTDLCYGYFGIKKEIFTNMKLNENNFGIEAEIAIKAKNTNCNIIEFGSIEYPRYYGSSNLNSIKDGWAILKTIFRNKMN